MSAAEIIRCARGEEPADLLLAGGRIVNVFSGEILPGSIAVKNGMIVGIGEYRARRTVALEGRVVAPGFIDAHVHIESAMLSVAGFARAVVVHGTTTVVADPHEIANVMGTDGIRYMLAASARQPLNVYLTLPSCVPATNMETSGARLTARDLSAFMPLEGIVGLAEVMNFPGVLGTDPEMMGKLALARGARKAVDGHCPGLSGTALNAYIAAGIASDHECTTLEEAREKLLAGMVIMVREGTAAKNLDALLPLITPRTSRRMMWCTDDRHPLELSVEGHIDSMVRRAIRRGVEPVTAIQMATLNPAEHFGLNHLGAVAPGRQADLVVLDDLQDVAIYQVYHRGQLVSEGKRLTVDEGRTAGTPVPRFMNLDPQTIDFSLPAHGRRARLIEVVPDQIVTRATLTDIRIEAGLAVADPARDILKIAVVDRHSGNGRTAVGFIRGLGFQRGAIASSVAHDAHNIIVAGVDDQDMQIALTTVAASAGGLAVVADGNLLAQLALPIAGLMSPEPLEEVCRGLNRLLAAARKLGSRLRDPFMTLSFMALPVIPALKITDRGLVDVEKFAIVPLFIE